MQRTTTTKLGKEITLLMKKEKRQEVYKKYGGRCAYCGEHIKYQHMQVDHIIPQNRYSERHGCLIVGCEKFAEYELNDMVNLNPACRKCNNLKSTFMIEDFRNQLQDQIRRARKYSNNFRTAERFGLVQVTEKPIVFYFETMK